MRTYGQYCGVARAADLLTERWALLIVRDLLVGPLRFGELRDGLGAPSNILTTRLKELEAARVVERALVPAPGRGVSYRLTPYGRDLEPILDAIGRWGARRMDERLPDDRVTDYSLASALRVAFRGGATRRTVWQVEAGPARAWGVTAPLAELRYGAGRPDEDPDVVIGGDGLRRLLAGRLAPAQALADGAIRVSADGDPATALREFARVFAVPLDDPDPSGPPD